MYCAFQDPAKIKAALAGSRESPLHVNSGTNRTRIVVFPDCIRTLKRPFDSLGAGFQTSYVKAQHSHGT